MHVPPRFGSRLLLPFVLLAVVGTGCEPGADRPAEVVYAEDAAQGEIPMRFEGAGEATLVVPVHIDGEGPFNFVLDTGATVTCVERAVASDLNLAAQPRTAIGAGAATAGHMDMVTVSRLRLAGTEVLDVTACVLDLEHVRELGIDVHGLLGLNVLRSFRVTLDFERGVVRLEEPAGG
jgi:predicted aspartyl protease